MIERTDGTLRSVQDSPFLVRTESSTRFCTVLRDITERKQAEAEIERRGIRLERLLEAREDDLERLRRALRSTVEIVSRIVETRDPYTAGHQRRVSELSARIAQQMGMSDAEVEETRTAALLHDVGKISVPVEILSKPGTLSPVEFELIKGHAAAGHRIIASADMEGPTAEIVYQHHERCDGSGYPRGLPADGLLPASKILMVADVVEAMASDRPYRAALGTGAALDEIARGSGTLYDEDVCGACATLFREGFAFSTE
jgi:putative nucleotidyltransferase with HDIG domain